MTFDSIASLAQIKFMFFFRAFRGQRFKNFLQPTGEKQWQLLTLKPFQNKQKQTLN
jgi:hypothetical protein